MEQGGKDLVNSAIGGIGTSKSFRSFGKSYHRIKDFRWSKLQSWPTSYHVPGEGEAPGAKARERKGAFGIKFVAKKIFRGPAARYTNINPIDCFVRQSGDSDK